MALVILVIKNSRRYIPLEVEANKSLSVIETCKKLVIVMLLGLTIFKEGYFLK